MKTSGVRSLRFAVAELWRRVRAVEAGPEGMRQTDGTGWRAEAFQGDAMAAVALQAHDVGKQLVCLRARTRRLEGLASTHPALASEVRELACIAGELAASLQGIVTTNRIASAETWGPGERLDRLVYRAVANVIRTRGSARIEVRLVEEAASARFPQWVAAVIENVLDNAVLASEQGAPIEIRAKRQPNGPISCVVSDSGRGLVMAPADVFGLGATDRTVSEGQGVGLALSKRLVESVGGMLEIHPRAEGGACAIVRLPLVPPEKPGTRVVPLD